MKQSRIALAAGELRIDHTPTGSDAIACTVALSGGRERLAAGRIEAKQSVACP